MKVFFLSISMMLFLITVSCGNERLYDSKIVFSNLVEEGFVRKIMFKKLIFKHNKKINTCVFGSDLNNTTQLILGKFYSFLSKEFIVFNRPIYKSSLDECPPKTHYYVFFHEGNESLKSIKDIRSKVYSLHDIKPTDKFNVDKLGFFTFQKKKREIIGFSSINQMSNLIMQENIFSKMLKAVILQELFQVYSMGLDIVVDSRPRTILEESSKNYINKLYELTNDAFSTHLNNNPAALCTFDTMFLILLYGHDKKSITLKDYLKIIEVDYLDIKNRALEIENNPTYKDLFDPRCSGKNTGINTKIGIE